MRLRWGTAATKGQVRGQGIPCIHGKSGRRSEAIWVGHGCGQRTGHRPRYTAGAGGDKRLGWDKAAATGHRSRYTAGMGGGLRLGSDTAAATGQVTGHGTLQGWAAV